MFYRTHAYIPEWKQMQLVISDLLPRGTILKMPWEGFTAEELDSLGRWGWVRAGHVLPAGLIVEYRDPEIDHILDIWFAMFPEDIDPVVDNLRVVREKRPVLVETPDLVVPTESRLSEEFPFNADATQPWQGSCSDAQYYAQQYDGVIPFTWAFKTKDYTLVQVGKPMRINRNIRVPA